MFKQTEPGSDPGFETAFTNELSMRQDNVMTVDKYDVNILRCGTEGGLGVWLPLCVLKKISIYIYERWYKLKNQFNELLINVGLSVSV